MTPEQRQVVYATKRGLGVTHIVCAVRASYSEPDYTYPVPAFDWRDDLPRYLALLQEVLRAGFVPVATLTNGGQDDWHYWFDNDAERFRAAVAVLEPVRLSVFWAILWEVIGPGGDWSPDQVQQATAYAREILGTDPVIGVEFGQGYIHLGDGQADWQHPGLSQMDALLCEFPQPVSENHEGCQQMADRVLPTGAGPHYLAPWQEAVAFESCAYDYCRGRIDDAGVAVLADYFKSLGFTLFGNGLPSR